MPRLFKLVLSSRDTAYMMEIELPNWLLIVPSNSEDRIAGHPIHTVTAPSYLWKAVSQERMTHHRLVYLVEMFS